MQHYPHKDAAMEINKYLADNIKLLAESKAPVALWLSAQNPDPALGFERIGPNQSGLVDWRMTFSLAAVKERALLVRSESLPMADEAARMQFQTVNVQQFLTDVSATGEPGGFDDAEKSARDFRGSIAKFAAMARRENNDKLAADIQAISTNFDAMYEVGVRMAKAYVQEGREAGNRIMKDFDARCDALSDSITPLKEGQLKEADEQVSAVVGALSADLTLQYILLAVSLAIGLVTAWLVSRGILRQLGAEPEVVAELARDVADGRFENIHATCDRNGQGCGVMATMVEMAKKLQTSFEEIAAQKAAAESKTEEAQRSRRDAEEAMEKNSTPTSLAPLACKKLGGW